MDFMRQELDELMGRDRNLPLTEKMKRKEYYDDPDVCKYNLVCSFCPHDLFPNTKCDLGKCMKRHDEFFRRLFDSDEQRIPFEKRYLNETISLIESLLVGVDSKIKRTQSKLDAPLQEAEKPKEIQDKLESYDKEIKKILEEVEKLGEQGKIEEAENLQAEADKIKRLKEDLLHLGTNPLTNSKIMKVCEICGALQAINDTEKRTLTHLEGKLHSGFALLRKELDLLKRRKEDIKNITVNPTKEIKRSSSKSYEKKRSRSKKRSKDRRSRSGKKHQKHKKNKSKSKSKKAEKKKKHHHSKKDRSRSRSRKKSSKNEKEIKHPRDKDNKENKNNKENNDFKDVLEKKDFQENNENNKIVVEEKSNHNQQIESIVKEMLDTGDRRNDRSQFYEKN